MRKWNLQVMTRYRMFISILVMILLVQVNTSYSQMSYIFSSSIEDPAIEYPHNYFAEVTFLKTIEIGRRNALKHGIKQITEVETDEFGDTVNWIVSNFDIEGRVSLELYSEKAKPNHWGYQYTRDSLVKCWFNTIEGSRDTSFAFYEYGDNGLLKMSVYLSRVSSNHDTTIYEYDETNQLSRIFQQNDNTFDTLDYVLNDSMSIVFKNKKLIRKVRKREDRNITSFESDVTEYKCILIKPSYKIRRVSGQESFSYYDKGFLLWNSIYHEFSYCPPVFSYIKCETHPSGLRSKCLRKIVYSEERESTFITKYSYSYW